MKTRALSFFSAFMPVLLTAGAAFAQTSGSSVPSGTSNLALDTMLAKFVTNIAGPMTHIVYTGAFIFGVYLLVKALFKCIKYSDEGSKGQQKFSGIWGTFLFATMLIALPSSMNMLGGTLWGESSNYGETATTYAGQILNYKTITDTDMQAKITRTYWTIMTFIQIVGLISFTRGLSILRSVTDGNTQVTSMAGLTHVIAGAIAWNLGEFVQTIFNTVGYQSQL